MKILLLATAALGLAATPALALKGNPHSSHGGRTMVHGRTTTHGHASTMSGHGRSTLSTRLDANRNGILDRREAGFRDRNRDGLDDRFVNRDANRYGVNDCPPGLAAKDNGCMPPGQAKRLFREGQRVPGGYNYYTDYNNIPVQYRNQYNLDPTSRYIYRDGQIYVVDPRTSLVQRVIGSLVGL